MSTQTKIKKSDVISGQAKSYQIGDNKIVVCNVNGQYFAISDICTHDDGELVSNYGNLIDTCQIECPRHGARFDVKTGKATRMPAVAPIKTYKINVIGDELEIEVEEDERRGNT